MWAPIVLSALCASCASPPPKVTAPAPPPSVDELTSFIARHKAERTFLHTGLAASATPEQKIQRANELLASARTSRKIAGAARMRSEDTSWAWNAFVEDENLAGTLFAEAGSDYTAMGDLQKARETYWAIQRIFTPPRFEALRKHADSRIMYLDDAARRRIEQ